MQALGQLDSSQVMITLCVNAMYWSISFFFQNPVVSHCAYTETIAVTGNDQ